MGETNNEVSVKSVTYTRASCGDWVITNEDCDSEVDILVSGHRAVEASSRQSLIDLRNAIDAYLSATMPF